MMPRNDGCRRIGNDVRHAQQTLRREVRGYVLPEPVHVGISIRSQHGRKVGFRITASRFGLAFARCSALRSGVRGLTAQPDEPDLFDGP